MNPTPLNNQIRENSLQYLGNALNWLNLRLNQVINPENVTNAQVNQAQLEMREGICTHPTPAFITLCQKLQLTEFEQNILLLCVAIEINPSWADLYAQAQKNERTNYPTFALALSLFDNPNWEAITPKRPLRYWKLISIVDLKGESLINCPLKVNERILHYLQGYNSLDDYLLSFFFPLTTPDSSTEENLLAPSQTQLRDIILYRLQSEAKTQQIPPILLLGANTTIKQIIAHQVCQTLGFSLYRFLIEQLPTNSQELQTFIRFWQRESQFLNLALYIDIQSLEGEATDSAKLSALRRFVLSCQGVFFLDSIERFKEIEGNKITLDVYKPTHLEQYQVWSQYLSKKNEIIAKQLTSQFNLHKADIDQIWQQNQQYIPVSPKTNHINANESLLNRLWQVCLAHTRPQLDNLAQRIELKASWDDIVLPEDVLAQLQQIVAQIRYRHQVYDEWGYRKRLNRGLGVSAVFAGESGTGKTMAAEVIANELQLNLYRIDLSAVVSKYIGETEKNLRRLFDAAEDGGAILFFDEADALFGKRSEVKDSHDRYANIEINYLLQRLESYSGLAILATNKKGSMDEAFLRRLRFIIDFAFPSPDLREKLWQKVFPPQSPLDDLDYAYLKQLNLTGGSIQNIALNASFLAAQNSSQIGMEHVKSALRSEFLKLGRSLNELNFI